MTGNEVGVVQRTWESREQPVLEAIAEAWEDGARLKNVRAVAEALDLDEGSAARALKALHEDGFIQGIDATDQSGYELLELEPTGKGRRVVGQWPSENGYEDLLRLLDERIAATGDADEHTRLQKVRDSFGDVTKQVGTSLLAAWLKGQVGIE